MVRGSCTTDVSGKQQSMIDLDFIKQCFAFESCKHRIVMSAMLMELSADCRAASRCCTRANTMAFSIDIEIVAYLAARHKGRCE